MVMYDITLEAPANFCKWCEAEIAQHLVTGQYFIRRRGACDQCCDTGDDDYRRKGHLTLATYVVGQVEKV